MKTFKKFITGAFFLILLCAGLSAIPAQNTHALSAPVPFKGTQPKPSTTIEYWQACAYKIAFNASGGVLDYCDTSSDFGYNYGGASLAPNAFTDATYKTSYGKTPPSGISLLDADANNPLVTAQTTTQSLALNNLNYSGQTYTAGTAPDTNTIKFYVYQPAAGAPSGNNYALLASMNNNGSLRVLAMVFNPPDKDGKVRAAAIDQTAIGSTSTGGNCATGQTGGSCGPGSLTNASSSVQKGDACDSGSDCKDNKCTKDKGDCSNVQKSCAENFVSFFNFIVCPALDLADSIMQGIYGQVEGQLCFNTGDSNSSQPGAQSSTGGITCDGQPNSLIAGVKDSWNIFKNIASALLVIVMLIMVISQAIGGGLFDAYTVRKMLPKLVAAVILMQLSYLLLKYAIDLSNDFGSAIGKVMMAPFGGPDNMNLGKMVGQGVHVATGGSTAGQATFDIFATVAAIGGAVWAIPALPLLALYVITATFIAFFVLIIRKLLIIMLVILAPLAFIAWVMPGTDRYWKLWRENLVKLLAMFPLIMAMLASGRIVAYITATSGNGASMFNPHIGMAHIGSIPVPYIASATGFADLAIIIGAYFAPYFLLPKTYSWGGQLLGQAGKAVENMTNKGSEPAKKLLKTREEGYREERRRKSMVRVRNEEDRFGRNPLKWGTTAVDKLRSGKWDPTLGRPKFIAGGSERRARAVDAYVHAGEELEQKNIEAARSRILGEGQKIRARGGNWDRYFQMVADGEEEYEDDVLGTIKIGKRSQAERDAARKQTAILGSATNWRYLEDYYKRANDPNSGMSEAERIRARKFFDDNVQTIMPKMPHFYQGYGAAADATGSTLAGQHGVEVESIISHFSSIIQDARRTPGERADAQRSLLTYLQNFKAAADNPNITLDNGALRAVKGFLDSAEGAGFRDQINTPEKRDGSPHPDGREVRGLPTVEAYDGLVLRPEVRAELDSISASLAPRIDPVTGTLASESAPAAVGGPVVAAPGVVVGPAAAAAPRAPAAGFAPPAAAPAAAAPVARVDAGELDIRQPSGTTPREDAYIQNTRADYDNMRRRIALGETLSPDEQRRLEQIRMSNPDW